LKNRDIARKSLVANGEILKGNLFSEMNIAIKRPGDGISPMRYWDLIGDTTKRDYRDDEKIAEHAS
jgi:sialic acid synthase SpsE